IGASVTLTCSVQTVLILSPSWLIPGTSVILNCKVQHPSVGWKFFWYKTVPKVSGNYSYELLPGSTSGTEQDSYIIHGQTHTAGYACRAGKGDPVYYTEYSEPKFVWSGVTSTASLSLTVNPDTVQHFHNDFVLLSCGENSSERRLSRYSEDGFLEHCCRWGTKNGSTRNVHGIRYGTVVYWCESGSAFSNAVNITGQDDDDGIILVSPVHPVTEGDSVILGCKLRTENVLSDVLFYKNDRLIQSDARGELSIPAVSKTDEGLYKCQYSGKESPQIKVILFFCLRLR
uniref:Ig-like domain-containing protein n=1 Tax=Acanthochromis polyacanthus TaxID=80966 RepID=A0A3Q1FAU1_9TELE